MDIRKYATTSLKISAAGIAMWVAAEGYRGVAYKPMPTDHWTIGHGSTKGVKPGDTTTPEKAKERTKKELNEFGQQLSGCVKAPLSQLEFDVYVNMAGNMGIQRFCSGSIPKLLNAGDYIGACYKILEYKYAQKLDCTIRSNGCYGVWLRRLQQHNDCMKGNGL